MTSKKRKLAPMFLSIGLALTMPLSASLAQANDFVSGDDFLSEEESPFFGAEGSFDDDALLDFASQESVSENFDDNQAPSQEVSSWEEEDFSDYADLSALVAAAGEVDNTTTLEDGEYVPESFTAGRADGKSSKITVSCEKVIVSGGKATAQLQISSTSMTYVYTDSVADLTKEESGEILALFNPETSALGENVYAIADQKVTIPVKLNVEDSFAARTTAMSKTNWIDYTYTITLAEPASSVITSLHPTNEELMFKVVNAYLEEKEGQTYFVFALSATGYENVFAGTYDQAIANGKNKANWITYSPASVEMIYATDRNGVVEEMNEGPAEKYQFRVPVTLNTSGTTRVPLVAISKTRVTSAEAENAENPDYSAAFTARQAIIDPTAQTVRTGNYQDTFDVTVTSSLASFKVNQNGTLYTIGTITANEYTCQPTLTMQDEAYDKAFIGKAEDAAAEGAQIISLGADKTFVIKLVNSLRKTPQVSATEPSVVSFHQVAADAWVETQMTIDTEAKTIAIAGEEPLALADYSAVDAALASIPASLVNYTDTTQAALTTAKNAVVRDLDSARQGEVDAMATAIRNAVAGLALKSADYSKVDAALAKIPASLANYTDETASAVTTAKNGVERNLDITKQTQVNAMAQAIETALAALAEKEADYAAVDAALAKVPSEADLAKYTPASVSPLADAQKAVTRGLKITKQADVDAMANALEDALGGLKKIPKKGQTITDPESGYLYYVRKAGKTVAFAGTANKNLKTLSVPAKAEIDGITYSVDSIHQNALKGYKKLKKVTLPKTITIIGNNAFMNCTALTSVTIPKNVTEIHKAAFKGDSKLLSITIKSKKLKTIASTAFTKTGSKNYKKLVVTVPKSKYNAYKKLLAATKLSQKATIKKG